MNKVLQFQLTSVATVPPPTRRFNMDQGENMYNGLMPEVYVGRSHCTFTDPDGSEVASITGYCINYVSTRLTRDRLISTVESIESQNNSHYRQVISKVVQEPGRWPISNTAIIIYSASTAEFKTIDEAKILSDLMRSAKSFIGRKKTLITMSVIHRNFGVCDVCTA